MFSLTTCGTDGIFQEGVVLLLADVGVELDSFVFFELTWSFASCWVFIGQMVVHMMVIYPDTI